MRIGRYSLYPTAFVDKNGTFWVLWSEHFFKPQKGKYLYAQCYTSDGQKIGGNFKLIEEKVGSSQVFSGVSMAPDGSFAVAWIGKSHDLFIQWFDSAGRGSGPVVRIDASDPTISYGQQLWHPDLCFDAQGDLLVAWGLNVNPPIFKGDYGNIFGLYFRDRLPYGSSFLIKERSPYAPHLDVFLGDDGSFWVSWRDATDIYINGWQWSPVDSGTFISEVFDTGPAGADFEKIFWTVEEIPETTEVKLKIRTGADLESRSRSDWYGPEDESGHYTYSGQGISSLHNGDRFIQYKVFFSTLDGRKTSTLYDISITYTSRDTVTPATPENLPLSRGIH